MESLNWICDDCKFSGPWMSEGWIEIKTMVLWDSGEKFRKRHFCKTDCLAHFIGGFRKEE